MSVGTTAARKSGTSVFRTVLRFCCGLIALLLVAVSAAGEDSLTWEERMARAREKYNRKTVNVYVAGHGKYRRGRINVRFYYSEKRPHMNINIRESLQITDEAEIEAVLEMIVKDKHYSVEEYGTVSFMKAEWIAHNLAHSMANGTEEQQLLIRMAVGESLTSIISSAKELDLSPLVNISDRQKMLYDVIELLYCRQGN